jgi:hypothetical protein
LDLDVAVSHADAEHESSCPDIGPICQVRAEPPQEHLLPSAVVEGGAA